MLLFPQIAIFVMVAFLHAIKRSQNGIFSFVIRLITLTCWYNIVLLPESGIGIIEWAFVLLTLGTLKISAGKQADSENDIIALGCLLFVAKVAIFCYFDENIYNALFLGNWSARLILNCFAILCIVLLILRLFRKVAGARQEAARKNALQVATVTTRKIATSALAIFGAQTLIIIVAVVALLVFLFVGKVYDDLVILLETFLQKATSTGKSVVKPSTPYYLFQAVALVILCTNFYVVFNERNIARAHTAIE